MENKQKLCIICGKVIIGRKDVALTCGSEKCDKIKKDRYRIDYYIKNRDKQVAYNKAWRRRGLEAKKRVEQSGEESRT